MSFRLLAISAVIVPGLAFPCMTHGPSVSRSNPPGLFGSSPRSPATAEVETFARTHRSPLLEAQLGNLLLKHGPDAVISLMIQVEESSYRPFGDAQSNARLAQSPHWKANEFIAYGVSKAGRRTYVFHPSLKVTKWEEKKLGPNIFSVRPAGWADFLYFDFGSTGVPIRGMVRAIPEPLRRFSSDRLAPNPEKIGKTEAYKDLMQKKLGEGYNRDPWHADNVHGRFPNAEGVRTAVGGVLTWGITEAKFGPFKQLYTCFEPRNRAEENRTGAPSGAGWHKIGDPAESLLNNLENLPIPVAIARPHQQKFAAYGMNHVITASWLKPDSALVTARGEFHWYLNPYEKEVCTEIWVHPCQPTPTNAWGFRCRLAASFNPQILKRFKHSLR